MVERKSPSRPRDRPLLHPPGDTASEGEGRESPPDRRGEAHRQPSATTCAALHRHLLRTPLETIGQENRKDGGGRGAHDDNESRVDSYGRANHKQNRQRIEPSVPPHPRKPRLRLGFPKPFHSPLRSSWAGLGSETDASSHDDCSLGRRPSTTHRASPALRRSHSAMSSALSAAADPER